MPITSTEDTAERLARLQDIIEDLLKEAKRQGASAAEASVGSSAGLDVAVRLGEVETVEHTRDNGLAIAVYFGHRKGSASTSDLSPAAVRDAVKAACVIASQTQEDRCAHLAPLELLATDFPDLDLYHPWSVTVEDAIALAVACEDAARSHDPRIINSDGASLSSHSSIHVVGNSHGFIGGYPTTRHSLDCAVIGQDGDQMQRDAWWTSARCAQDLESAQQVGERAAARTVARLGARRIPTQQTPVLFRADIASGLLGGLISAISGGSIYRRASFLLDHVGERIFPEFVRIHELPHLPRGLASAPFDGDGVATRAKDFITNGVLQTYLLSVYSGCRLGLPTTGNAGGVRNVHVVMGDRDRAAMLRELDTGLMVTELMGHGVNLVTGDYSQGAAGFWVERGEIQYPVEEITIAGNLKTMFAGLVDIGNDCDFVGRVRTGSWLIDQMTIAGE
ncbi:metalloprotease PmbA [Chromatium okenii]|uniref:metalloprotease PmbA n=1 Tax=Chromatium okenii TaxID=61644 RepID=UPI0026F16BB8|nr:metalloprotease PmbA [Chromatium okenii]MBV5308477.1 metalloprotease PmbA [Chromatium okenii]